MTAAPLIIGAEEEAALAALRELAALHPVEVRELLKRIKTPDGEAAHRAQMQSQTCTIDTGPFRFFVTFSIETGHGAGTCRHMSVSILREGRVPSREAVVWLAALIGFTGGINDWAVWPEKLRDGGIAINVVQPLAVHPEARA